MACSRPWTPSLSSMREKERVGKLNDSVKYLSEKHEGLWSDHLKPRTAVLGCVKTEGSLSSLATISDNEVDCISGKPHTHICARKPCLHTKAKIYSPSSHCKLGSKIPTVLHGRKTKL